jgi:GTP-binding protein EngB required for normal cell division
MQSVNMKDLLEEGREKIEFSDNKDIVLVLGNTGAGKSTFLQWIAGDDSKLISVEVGVPGSGEFIIIDDGTRIGNSTLNSMTLFPELIEKEGTSFYDCPGFSDTRSSSHEIAITYFVKKVCDDAKRVKMVFVVNYSSVRKGVDRQDFNKFLTHIAEFIKDIKKFGQSVALLVTKVDNLVVKNGKTLVLVENDFIIGGIALFLEEFKQSLNERLVDNMHREDLYRNMIDLIDIFLTKTDESYTKIGLFRRPDEAGPLSELELLQEPKLMWQNKIKQELIFTPKTDNDFGYTLSAESLNFIFCIFGEINNEILQIITDIAMTITKQFQDLTQKELQLVEAFKHGVTFDAKQKSNARNLITECETSQSIDFYEHTR